ncbi:unnamed protein product [Gordionus sp. m RMFG-2023]
MLAIVSSFHKISKLMCGLVGGARDDKDHNTLGNEFHSCGADDMSWGSRNHAYPNVSSREDIQCLLILFYIACQKALQTNMFIKDSLFVIMLAILMYITSGRREWKMMLVFTDLWEIILKAVYVTNGKKRREKSPILNLSV